MAWSPEWLATARKSERELWRSVEAQHQVATMRLVDDLEEQQLLEQLLDASKPPLTVPRPGLHYLVFTPFRYSSPWPSRFRRPNEPGAWYGADTPATVAAETAFWRWRFFHESEGLRGEQVVAELTFFQARFQGLELDITCPPWSDLRNVWRHSDDYGACQHLAGAARGLNPPVQAIRYESARREKGMCEVVFDMQALTMPRPHLQQTWVCKTTADRVLLTHDREQFEFLMPASASS